MSDERERAHTPVLVDAVLDALRADEELGTIAGWIVDATIGAGGHARAILEAFPSARVFGVDRDPEVLELAREELAPFGERIVLRRGRLSELDTLLRAEDIDHAVAVLFDLGASSLQLDRPERGFSFQADGPLDMRMDPDIERTAADVVNRWDEADLADLIFHEGGERRSRRIARAIVEGRRRVPFLRTLALADAIAGAIGSSAAGRTHPATKTFQALRRAVNQEGVELAHGLLLAEAELQPSGRLVVITFHSGEDGVVKRFLAEGARAGRWRLVGKKPVEPSRAEVRSNPRSRSARLRAAVRVNGRGKRGEE
ncbi:MAG: 16S rRNA (cytosine(1402)-N(4))-methyltransferase RsmH [Planctomycetota bacterium]|nr:16S rRNA (cytosine(1402)-N(4))-methyltransferase RsmH [Planctomycetota bacterium]